MQHWQGSEEGVSSGAQEQGSCQWTVSAIVSRGPASFLCQCFLFLAEQCKAPLHPTLDHAVNAHRALSA